MFGPNARTTPDGSAHFHHRGPDYHALLEDVTALFYEKCGVTDDYDVLFLTGSGTLANEAVVYSLEGRIAPPNDRGEFSQRLSGMIHAHGKALGHMPVSLAHQSMVAYETGESRVVGCTWPAAAAGTRFVDCVSSFPYYAPPASADVWTTVSGKQLAGLPGLGIVAVRRNMWYDFKKPDAAYSYLNLARYGRAYEEKRESPHTPAFSLLWDLRTTLQGFDMAALRARVRGRRLWLASVLAEASVGDGPVFTVKFSAISEQLAAKWNLYRSAYGWQFFLYSGTDDEYMQFTDDYLRREL